jgi:hypothetical protein
MHGIGRGKNLQDKLKKLHAMSSGEGEAVAAGRHEPRAEPHRPNHKAA